MKRGQAGELLVDHLAKLVGTGDARGVRPAHRVDDARVGAPLLVGNADVGGGGARDFTRGFVVAERLAPDDRRAAFRVERDHLQAGLDVAGDVLDRRETSPGDDLFDVLGPVQRLLDGKVAALPVRDREMLGDWVARCDVGEGAGDRDRSQRVVRRRLDDGVAPGDHRAQDRHRRHQAAVARRDVQHPRPERPHPQLASVGQSLAHPAVEVSESDLAVGDFEDVGPREQRLQHLIAVLEHVRGQRVGQQRRLVGLLQVGVGVEHERVAERFKHVEDFAEGDVVQVGHRHRTRQWQAVHVAGHIGRLELGGTAACAEGHQVVGDQFAPQEKRNGIGTAHDSNAFMKLTASLCTSWVAAQVMRSSSTPCFSL